MHNFSAHRHVKDEDEDWSRGTKCAFGWLVLLAKILLFGALGLVLYWVLNYRDGYAWREDVKKEFNLHPTLMIAGFIFFMGNAMLTYRTCRCCKRIYNKLLHTCYHIMAIPCIAIGFIAVYDTHNRGARKIPDFYSLHSWLGLITMGLFGLQFIVGFFSFLILLCCESATAAFRANLVPVHSTFGITTFMLAIATAVTGLTEKAFIELSFTSDNPYSSMPEEGLIMNALGVTLAALGILMPFLLKTDRFRALAIVEEYDERL